MTAKQYLQRYKSLKCRFLTTCEQIKSIESDVIHIKSPGFDERVTSSPKSDPIGDMVCDLEQKKGKLGLKMFECQAEMLMIQKQVDVFEEVNNDYYIILLFRYILFRDWQSICDTLHLSRSHANKLHGDALKEFDKKFGKLYADR